MHICMFGITILERTPFGILKTFFKNQTTSDNAINTERKHVTWTYTNTSL